ncbi:MAG: hypothetical protein FJZ47_25935 [Candidatus Tectomicrobia bacterium]|uniref:Uncharacterized protein n=1 Tax=Tectimicrobiota bacterium TaxID=2528274 RepID=A0A937W5Z3_UNCTE|nr:hypothetical protein [Candidatus Tectomicrobia bacterium]
MSSETVWPWLVLLGLGAFHGMNPGMGWLFAVSLGLQEQRRQAVLRALVPLACGHAASILAVALVLGLAQVVLPEALLRAVCAGGLLAFGAYRFVRARHPRWVGLRVTSWDLMVWSFLMASAHGAGLMLVPVLLHWPAADYAHARLLQSLLPAGISGTPGLLLTAVGVHTLSMLLVTAAVALLVYEKLGLALLRQAWFNIDALWAGGLLLAGLSILLL